MKVENISAKTIDFFKRNKKRIVCTGLLAGAISLPFDEAIMEEHDNAEFTRLMNTPKVEQTVDYQAPKATDPVTIPTKDGRVATFEERFDDYAPEPIELDEMMVSTTSGEKEYKVDLSNDESIGEVVSNISKQLSNENVEVGDTFVITTPWVKSPNYSVTTPEPASPRKQAPIENVREYQRTIYTIRPNAQFNRDYFEKKFLNVNFGLDYNKIVEYFRVGDAEHVFDVIDEQEERIVVDEQEEKDLNTGYFSLNVNGEDVKIAVRTKEAENSETKIAVITIILGLAFVILVRGTEIYIRGY